MDNSQIIVDADGKIWCNQYLIGQLRDDVPATVLESFRSFFVNGSLEVEDIRLNECENCKELEHEIEMQISEKEELINEKKNLFKELEHIGISLTKLLQQ